MEKLIVKGPTPLKGEVTISGAKNAAVAILPATLLIDGVCTIENLPNISDIEISCTILERLGAKITRNSTNSITVDTRNITTTVAPIDLTSKFRASYYIIGAMLGRMGEIEVGMPGGCKLGARPIDQHIKGFEALGAEVVIEHGAVSVNAENLHAANIFFDVVSVGATINVMIAATMAEGTTVLENVAKEPHVVDVANFLNSMGANIRGAGTDVIKIRGVSRLHKTDYSIIPDQIEAGTFMFAAAATRGDVTVMNVIPKHLECIGTKLEDMGVKIEMYDDSIRVIRNGPLRHTNLKTMPYPGFPTDMHPQMAAAMVLADGSSHITEGVWPNRFRYAEELEKMGAHISVFKETAVIEGVPDLFGTDVVAHDLRAGAAMVIAGLAAQGVTTVSNIGYVERGYEKLVEKVCGIGGEMERVNE